MDGVFWLASFPLSELARIQNKRSLDRAPSDAVARSNPRSRTMLCVLWRMFMPSRLVLGGFLLLFAPFTVHAQGPELSKAVQEFVRSSAGKVVLTHVRIIDGAGGPAV